MEGVNSRSETCDFAITKDMAEDTNQNEEMEDETRMVTLHEAAEALLGVSILQSMGYGADTDYCIGI